VSTLYDGLNQYHVVMEVRREYWQHPDTLNAIYVASANGPSSALGDSRFGGSASPLAVNHQSQFPAATLSFNLRPGASLGDAVMRSNRARDDIRMPASSPGIVPGNRASLPGIAGQ
jgi:multidrug efflux pump